MPSLPHEFSAGSRFAASALIIGLLAAGGWLGAGCATTDDTRSPGAAPGATLERVAHDIPLNEQIARLAGVRLSKSGELRIRGALGPPLVVIDGTQLGVGDGSLWFLDPADIARIEIVKGPQTAIYGQRGIQGVIEVTTKHQASISRR